MRTHNDSGKQDRIMGMRGKPTAGLWDMGVIYRPIKYLTLMGSLFPERSANVSSVLSTENSTVAITIFWIVFFNRFITLLRTPQTVHKYLNFLLWRSRAWTRWRLKQSIKINFKKNLKITFNEIHISGQRPKIPSLSHYSLLWKVC